MTEEDKLEVLVALRTLIKAAQKHEQLWPLSNRWLSYMRAHFAKEWKLP